MSELFFARLDLIQTGTSQRGTMAVLPLSKGRQQQKVAVGDSDGVLQACYPLVARIKIYAMHTTFMQF